MAESIAAPSFPLALLGDIPPAFPAGRENSVATDRSTDEKMEIAPARLAQSVVPSGPTVLWNEYGINQV